jgi:excisionase family DNA binding protein
MISVLRREALEREAELERAKREKVAAKVPAPQDDDELLTPDQVARIVRLHPRTVRKLIARGELPGVKIARQWRTRKGELMERCRSKNANR